MVLLKNGGRHVDNSFITGKLHHEGGLVFFLIALAILAPILFYLHNSERGLANVPSMKDAR